jgi:hypothetical protein
MACSLGSGSIIGYNPGIAVRRRIDTGGYLVKLLIRLSAREELKALPILLRHSAGMALPNATYVISSVAAQALREAGVQFSEISSEVGAPNLQGVVPGERV